MKPPQTPTELLEGFLPGLVEAQTLPEPRVDARVVMHVLGSGVWSFGVERGRLAVSRGPSELAVLQVAVHLRDFDALIVQPLTGLLDASAGGAVSQRAFSTQALARVARWDAETVDLVRRQTGSIVVELADGPTLRKVAVSPGLEAPSFEQPRCRLRAPLEDVLSLSSSNQSPFDLFYGGRLEISGDAQIAVALAGLFV